eukprot:CAMPEP_0175867914 /NCGR_PEP_ID=MMETSP0107_2-20121207/35089_1 /TAXON_ID=195067 ORGANISM="Goniomonas pacifica, Strain CCMP1869" /NCGR_SAMPLE_ID=MMETSP0107_2 /ASSEMBLY_ACC=CAM_ASM_000203 /LENGTH=122 /DNA_ID=CAMNT_0017185725 /DNA_START=595 /DNA_END=963 /DNA_ORIENTATION=+
MAKAANIDWPWRVTALAARATAIQLVQSPMDCGRFRHALQKLSSPRHSTTQQQSNTAHGTEQHAQHSTAHNSTQQHNTAQHSTQQHSTTQHSTAQHSTQTQQHSNTARAVLGHGGGEPEEEG